MIKDIQGLHHVTALASDARQNNAFYTDVLGLRRVKTTVNFDAPDIYHLYYGDTQGAPGTIMTYFPFPGMRPGRPGKGEVGTTGFSIPTGAAPYWVERLVAHGVKGIAQDSMFGEARVGFDGPDGERLALIERNAEFGTPWTNSGVPADVAVRGFHSVRLRLAETARTAELLRFMGYAEAETDQNVTRYAIADGNAADLIDIEAAADARDAGQGAGSIHHVAFAVEDLAAEQRVRQALLDTGYQVTPVIDRDYFKSIYFRTPGGVLFEIATNDPGFARDEATDALGTALKLPAQHEHLRQTLSARLAPLDGMAA